MSIPDLPPEYRKKADNLKMDFYQIQEKFIRGSGAGGQKINKTSSCVQLIYPPLNIDVKCQKHREREKNRISAYKLLINKIELLKKGSESTLMKKMYKIRKQKQKRTKRAKEKMLELKKRRGVLKKERNKIVIPNQ
ncbi:hypothetical protein A2483_05925 [Candidatus Peregrinibacteria bacterium RIFOXYC2_FULL_33_13]|nr:MAG: Peptide chain release factor [Candidatus Peregrinibacteria bacterium GW2011_GWA2_33_10]KKP39268.1 MAG: peptide chain release factor [Candidatus Peregrinibacteria bacterium GW2011_GWC2_33_13]OGJ53624.1 MAG: hypothetical protein A2483_05925 [Candidatus Peregrinibacteria bacterium RIFOXYC2_FULL_33_13]